MSNLIDSLYVAESGMKVQAERMKIISQNIVNNSTTSLVAGGDPYRRQVIFFQSLVGNNSGSSNDKSAVRVAKKSVDTSPFRVKYEPYHPAADADGYVKYPNVDESIELADAQEAGTSYQANLSMIKILMSMINKTLDMISN